MSDRLEWARRIVARYKAGEHMAATVVRFAHEALGLDVPKGCR